MQHVVVQLLSHILLRDPTACSTLGFPVLHYLPELAQTLVHWVSDATQPQCKRISFFGTQPSLWSKPHIHTWLLEKKIALTRWDFVSKVMSLLFNTLSRFVIAFLSRSKSLLILWLQSSSTVILDTKKIKYVSLHFFPYICHEVMGLDAMILVFLNVEF